MHHRLTSLLGLLLVAGLATGTAVPGGAITERCQATFVVTAR